MLVELLIQTQEEARETQKDSHNNHRNSHNHVVVRLKDVFLTKGPLVLAVVLVLRISHKVLAAFRGPLLVFEKPKRKLKVIITRRHLQVLVGQVEKYKAILECPASLVVLCASQMSDDLRL